MFYRPELFVYVMLLPVVCLVVLPALFSATRVAIGAVKTSGVTASEQTFEQEPLAAEA